MGGPSIQELLSIAAIYLSLPTPLRTLPIPLPRWRMARHMRLGFSARTWGGGCRCGHWAPPLSLCFLRCYCLSNGRGAGDEGSSILIRRGISPW